VHIKLTPDGEFEGCDDASNWQDFESRTLPEIVRNKIQFPDKVVVRPAPHDISFNHFMVLFFLFYFKTIFYLFIFKIK